MTSEVVVMNRLGIALASDSVATVRSQGKPKFFHADKLFMLSNFRPVGAMVYGNSTMMGVPWEVILKLFRAQLADKSFLTLQEYATHLIEFLTDNAKLFPEDVQERYYRHLISTFFGRLQREIKEKFDDLLDAGEEVTQADLEEIPVSVVERALAEWKGKADATCFTKDVGAELKAKQSGLITAVAAEVFEDLLQPKVLQTITPNLYELTRLLVQKEEILRESVTGLVIAGYGEDQHFPAMQQYLIGEVFEGQPKRKLVDTWEIGKGGVRSVIKPFAQSAMAQTFLEGISPKLEIKVAEMLTKAIIEGPQRFIDGFPGVSQKRRDEYKLQVLGKTAAIARDAIKELGASKLSRHRAPIQSSVVHLPKKELAHVAASLVSLSSFQKRMTTGEDETVGGPIDVAVISKGDGFIWIERKHYFKPELNEHFFRNRPNRANTGAQRDDQGEEGKGEP